MTRQSAAPADARIVVGLGVSAASDGPAALPQIREAVACARREHGLPHAQTVLATRASKAGHPAVGAVAAGLGAQMATFDDVALGEHAHADPRVLALTGGLGSVAGAAVLASGARPLHEKRVAAGCTYVVGVRAGRDASPGPGAFGPGAFDPAALGPSVSVGPTDSGDPADGIDQVGPVELVDASSATPTAATPTAPAAATPAADTPADPLRHHGDVEARGAEIDLAVNIAAARPPDFLLDALRRSLHDVAAYPDERPTRERLAHALGAGPDRLLLVNGAAQAFSLVAHARPWRAPTIVHPQFTEPDAALAAAGRPARHHTLRESDGFALDPRRFGELADADLVVVGNPTNPTSRLHPAATLRALAGAGAAGPPDRVLLVDEAFLDVVPAEAESLLPLAASGRHPGLLVLRSLTKTFALAGIRAGYLVGDPGLIARLRELQPPWSVNTLALAAIDATSTPRARAHTARVTAALGPRRVHLVRTLTDCGLSVLPDPAGPFVLARHPRAHALREALRRNGIAVRRGDTFPGLGPQWLRFAVRDEATTDTLGAAIRAALPNLQENPR